MSQGAVLPVTAAAARRRWGWDTVTQSPAIGCTTATASGLAAAETRDRAGPGRLEDFASGTQA